MKLKGSIIIEVVFLLIGFIIYFISGNNFYIFNFAYIGTAIAIGVGLLSNGYKYGRNVVMIGIGCYILIFLGIINHENMLMSGFWYYLFLGVFEAAVIHFLVAKIIGPFLFGRGWCGYACWTAMILDLLPYKVPQNPRKSFGYVRYILFIAILGFVSGLFILNVSNLESIIYYTFIVGNIIYYAVGISLAFILKDNRAFCKYVCPITVFLKPTSYFSLLRVTVEEDKCISCNKCLKNCPMDVDMLNNSRKRENGTECILCMECVRNCPSDALDL
ncbi:MAG: 4Fe-4S dicluster domain-containing protein [Methanobrevibacter sp.]|nr:4Fe-4S dicluster domain-containing protein [Methanobrevibacter sp.]